MGHRPRRGLAFARIPRLAASHGTLLLFLLAAPAAHAQSFDRWLPRDTVVYFSVENADRLRTHLARGPLPALFELPEARDSLGALRSFFVGRGSDPEATWALLAHPTGQVVIALWDRGGEEFDVDGALLADVRGNERGFLHAWNALLRAEEREHDVAHAEEEAFGVTLHGREFRAGGETIRSAWFLHEGVFGFAPSRDALKQMLARRRAEGGSLLADESYQRFRRGVPASADILLHVSGRLWSARAAPALQPTLAVAGLDNLAAIGVQLSFLDDGVASRVRLDIRGARRGALAIFRAPIEDLAPPPWLPRGTEAAATFNLDHKALLREMLEASDAIRPGFAKALEEEIARLSRDRNLDLRRDLLAGLGPRTTLALLPLDARLRRVAARWRMDPALFGLAVVQEVRDGAAMERVLAAGLGLFGPVPSRTIGDVRVYLVPGRGGGAVAIFGNHLVLARHVDLVEDMITRWRNGAPGLHRGAAFLRALRYVPEKRAAFSFIAPPPPPTAALRTDDERTRRLLRAADLAPVGWWRRYHDLSVFSVSDAPDGLLLTWFTGLRAPAQLPIEK